MEKIRIALIGAGYIAHYHVKGLLTLRNVELVAVVSKQIENARKFAKAYDIPHAFSSISKVIEDHDIDAVIISTPNALHAPYAIACLEHGKDVFLEKPMAMNSLEGRQIDKIAETCGRLVMVGHMWRFDTETQYLKNIIEKDTLGKVFKTKSYGIHENWGPSGWFTESKLAGGGALADMGVHAIDTIRFLLGDPAPIRVFARISTQFGNYEVDDTAILVITWENGTESIIESGWWHPHMDGPEASSGIFGTKGYASLFPTFLKLSKGVEKFETIKPEFPVREEHCDQKIYTRQMQYFVDCIRKRTKPVPGLHEGQTVLQIVDAAYASSQEGKVIDL